MNILPGIARAVVIDLAREAGIKVREGRWRLPALKAASEVLLTNSLMEVMPAGGPPGPVTRILAKGYRRLIEAP